MQEATGLLEVWVFKGPWAAQKKPLPIHTAQSTPICVYRPLGEMGESHSYKVASRRAVEDYIQDDRFLLGQEEKLKRKGARRR